MSRSLREWYESSKFSSAQAPFLEEQYERYLNDPSSVAPAWRLVFESLGAAPTSGVRRVSKGVPGAAAHVAAAAAGSVDGEKQAAVSRLIQFYAHRGHL